MFHNDIAILACYPHNLVYCHTLFHLIKRNFKHIFFLYSDVHDFDINKGYHKSLFAHNNVSVIKVDNIGYDFYKYYCGFKEIKKHNMIFNKVWCINDSFFIGNWNYFCNQYSKRQGDIIGCYKSRYIKRHLQSFLLIMNNKSMNLYFDFFEKYNNFIVIDTEYKKNKIISDIEINFNNDIICRPDVTFDTIFKFSDNQYSPCIHPSVYYGFRDGIYKSNAFSFCDTYNMKSSYITNFVNNGIIDTKILFCFIIFDDFKLILDKNKHLVTSNNYLINNILGKNIKFNSIPRLLYIILSTFKNNQYRNKFIHKFISNFKNM